MGYEPKRGEEAGWGKKVKRREKGGDGGGIKCPLKD